MSRPRVKARGTGSQKRRRGGGGVGKLRGVNSAPFFFTLVTVSPLLDKGVWALVQSLLSFPPFPLSRMMAVVGRDRRGEGSRQARPGADQAHSDQGTEKTLPMKASERKAHLTFAAVAFWVALRGALDEGHIGVRLYLTTDGATNLLASNVQTS